MIGKNKASAYQSVNLQSDVLDASPHRVIQLLMQGFIDRINVAIGHMQNNNVAQKGEFIKKSIDIVMGLQASLDMDQGGEISEQLDELYNYMTRRLTEANLKNDVAILEEVKQLMGTIKEGWDQVSESTAA